MSYNLAKLVRAKLDACDEENRHMKKLSACNDDCNEEILFQLCIKEIIQRRIAYHETRLDMITDSPKPLDAVSYVEKVATWINAHKLPTICNEMTIIGNHRIFDVSPDANETAAVIDREWRDRLEIVAHRINKFLERELPEDSLKVRLVTQGSGSRFTFKIEFIR